MAQAEYEAQGTESIGEAAGRVVLLPTVIINNKQYRGRLDTVSITKALCAGFDETTEPEVMHLNTCSAIAVNVVLVCSQPVLIRTAAALHSGPWPAQMHTCMLGDHSLTTARSRRSV